MFSSFDVVQRIKSLSESVEFDTRSRMLNFVLTRDSFLKLSDNGYRCIRGVAFSEDLFKKRITLSVPIRSFITSWLSDVDDLTDAHIRSVSNGNMIAIYSKNPF